MGAAIRVEHLYKTYGKLTAVNNLSFEVEQGSCYAFLGPNGAGKTSMMKSIYGKARPDEHPETTMSIFGHDPRRDELAVKSLSGVVPQEESLDVELNVLQNLRIFANFYQMPRRKADARIDELLEFMELTEKRSSLVRELSGGMKRRLVIARALLNRPALLILDEPTTGLDPQVRHLIWDRLRHLMREGVTILLTTHYMEEAFQIADTILIMDKGVRQMEGNPAALLRDEIETHVLELSNPALAEQLDHGLNGASVRREHSGDRLLFYSDDLQALKRAESHLEYGSSLLRPTNLEDLFLRATGRGLNEHQ
ncbi:MAG: ABC transporter ATP-binding protein [Alkalispirochaetaceae bacterium]